MHRRVTRRGFLAAVGAAGSASLAGCADGSADPGGSGDAGGSPSTITGGPRTAKPDEPPPLSDASLPLPGSPTEVREHVVSGGVPKDGIPSIDRPRFVGADAVDFLRPGDVVFGVAGGDDVKAYPQSILVHHEICNDVVDGTNVAVTYCPLTGTAMGFERGPTTFGVSGRLVNSNLIMYDRGTNNWWPQVLSTAIPRSRDGKLANPEQFQPGRDGELEVWKEADGTYTGKSLRGFRVIWTTWGRWKRRHPETRVLSTETGFVRDYNRDPYGGYNPREGYYSPDRGTLFSRLNPDDRYAPKRVVVGARTSEGAVAFLKDSLRDRGLVEGELAGTPVLGVYDPGLDTAYVYRNPEGGSFAYRGGTVRGPGGGTHDPDALPLERVLALDAMWFAWSGFYPETNVHE